MKKEVAVTLTVLASLFTIILFVGSFYGEKGRLISGIIVLSIILAIELLP